MASYAVRAVWDTEAGVFWSESDVPGLNVEAETLSAFVGLVEALAPDLLRDNGMEAGPITITGETALKAAS
jgi:hypothetical protein